MKLKVFENVRSVKVEVKRYEDGLWYFVRISWRDDLYREHEDTLTGSQDVNAALDLKDRIDAALDSGVKRLEVTV